MVNTTDALLFIGHNRHAFIIVVETDESSCYHHVIHVTCLLTRPFTRLARTPFHTIENAADALFFVAYNPHAYHHFCDLDQPPATHPRFGQTCLFTKSIKVGTTNCG